MHQDINFMAITTERKRLSVKAARGWQMNQTPISNNLARPVVSRVRAALTQLTQTVALVRSRQPVIAPPPSANPAEKFDVVLPLL